MDLDIKYSSRWYLEHPSPNGSPRAHPSTRIPAPPVSRLIAPPNSSTNAPLSRPLPSPGMRFTTARTSQQLRRDVRPRNKSLTKRSSCNSACRHRSATAPSPCSWRPSALPCKNYLEKSSSGWREKCSSSWPPLTKTWRKCPSSVPFSRLKLRSCVRTVVKGVLPEPDAGWLPGRMPPASTCLDDSGPAAAGDPYQADQAMATAVMNASDVATQTDVPPPTLLQLDALVTVGSSMDQYSARLPPVQLPHGEAVAISVISSVKPWPSEDRPHPQQAPAYDYLSYNLFGPGVFQTYGGAY